MLASALTAGLLTAGCTSTDRAREDSLAGVDGPLVVAVGDIACEPGSAVTTNTCLDAATAEQARAYDPHLVFALGDTQYSSGRANEFRDGYADSWGELQAITRPVPGNHEYDTDGASGYYEYFADQTEPPGYYAFDVDDWRVYALNSNCDHIDCAAENTWLEQDLADNPRRCIALLMHHPLYSSGAEHGDSPEGRRFWITGLEHHADLVLAGHDHVYERFEAMDADGNLTDSGIVSFVVGTGGKSLYQLGTRRTGSQVFQNEHAGVLALKLGEGRYAWQYETIDGNHIDSGIADCV